MSYNWLTVRGGSMNPSSLKFQALMNKQNIAENELFKPDQFTPKSISASTEDTVLIQDPFFFTKLKTKTNHYKAPFEPDGQYLRLWMRFNHLGNTLKDSAFKFGGSGDIVNPIFIKGNPKLCEGPDDGVKGGRIVTQLNSNPDNLDYYICLNPDEQNVGILDISDFALTGYSMYVDFMLEGAPVQDNGQDPTIWFHVDDVNGDFGTCLRIGNTRELIIATKVAGSQVCKAATTTPIQSNVWYRACINYLLTGAVTSMRINNIPQTLVNSTNQTFPDSHENSVFIGVGQDLKGRFIGRLADIRWYRDLVFWNQHMDNIWNNHRSICATPVLQFDGVNDTINLGNDSALWSQALTKFSFSFWMYPTIINDGINRLVTRHGNTAHGFECDIDSTVAGQIFFLMHKADNSTLEANNGTGGDRIQLNKWNKVACSYNSTLGSANGRIYTNGVIGSTTFDLTETINSSNIFELGGPSTDFIGYWKDFKWWTNHGLNTDEAQLEFEGKYTVVPDYWLKFIEGVGDPVDSITRTKVGSLGSPVWTMGSSPIPTQFGSLAVAGYSRFNDTIDTGGYDITGYDDTGFDTT